MAEKKTETLTLEQVQAQIAAMMAEARAAQEEAARLLAQAKATASGKMSAEEAEQREKDAAYMEELVEIKLFKDTGKYKDDVFVGCNGENIAIQRGERVKIKRKFVEILDNSEHQDYETAKLIEQKTNEWKRANGEN